MQLCIALQNYEAAHEVLPPGVVNDKGPIQNVPKGYHWAGLPRSYPTWNRKTSTSIVSSRTASTPPRNQTVRGSSSGLPVPVRREHEPGRRGRPPSSYAACYNDVEAPIDVKNTGVFFLNSAVRSEDIPDGRSCTIFLGERLVNPSELGWASGTRATLRNTGAGRTRRNPSGR